MLFRSVLNALLWISKVDVPEGGVDSEVTDEDLMKNLDPKKGRRPRVQSKRAQRQTDTFVSSTIVK